MKKGFKEINKVFTKSPEFNLGEEMKLAILSDSHIGDGKEGSDDFKENAWIYKNALEQYRTSGFTLILLGDIEELWECSLEKVISAYKELFEKHTEFQKDGRLTRIVGNHDIFVSEKKHLEKIKKKLKKEKKEKLIEYLPKPQKYPWGLKLKYKGETLFLIHGHQPDFLSNKIWKISRFFVRYFWKPIQILFKITSTSPYKVYKVRNHLEQIYYSWANEKKVVIITGHTHRPMFESKAKIDRLADRLNEKINKIPKLKETTKEYRDTLREIKSLEKEMEKKIKEEGISSNLEEAPVYFNSGCCIFPDHVITAIEIEKGEIRLVGFKEKGDGKIEKKIYESEKLTSVFSRIKSGKFDR